MLQFVFMTNFNLDRVTPAEIAELSRDRELSPQFNTSDATSFRKAVDMSDDELAAIAARAKLTLVEG